MQRIYRKSFFNRHLGEWKLLSQRKNKIDVVVAWAQVGSTIASIAALVVSIIVMLYTKSSSEKSLSLTQAQLNLSQKQFEEAIKSKRDDSVASIEQFQFQKESNRLQIENLVDQNNISKAQLKQQNVLYNDQLAIEKPTFITAAIEYPIEKNNKVFDSTIFLCINKGRRPAYVSGGWIVYIDLQRKKQISRRVFGNRTVTYNDTLRFAGRPIEIDSLTFYDNIYIEVNYIDVLTRKKEVYQSFNQFSKDGVVDVRDDEKKAILEAWNIIYGNYTRKAK